MHVFVDAETVKRAAATKRGVREWGVVSQVRTSGSPKHGSRRARGTDLRRRHHHLPPLTRG